jgi:hypothetical protein
LSPLECVRLAQASSAQNATGLGSQAGVRDLPATLEFIRLAPTLKEKDLTFGNAGMALS